MIDHWDSIASPLYCYIYIYAQCCCLFSCLDHRRCVLSSCLPLFSGKKLLISTRRLSYVTMISPPSFLILLCFPNESLLNFYTNSLFNQTEFCNCPNIPSNMLYVLFWFHRVWFKSWDVDAWSLGVTIAFIKCPCRSLPLFASSSGMHLGIIVECIVPDMVINPLCISFPSNA